MNETVFERRGVYYLDGRVTCPMAGVGQRGARASNRLALEDDDTRVTVDRPAACITIDNRARYPKKHLIADLTFLADGRTASGAETPLAIHLEVFKTGSTLSLDLHRHLRTQERLVAAEFEPFEVVVTDGSTEQVVLDPAGVRRLVSRPSLALRVVKALMAMRDNRAELTQDPRRPGFRVVDLSLGFGRPRLAWMMVRAALTSLSADNAELLAGGSLQEMLARGAWELELTALTEKYLPQVVKRDLFLFGLEDCALLAPVVERGLTRGQRLAFRFSAGDGEVALDGQTAPLPEAADVARAYIEFHMLGGLLAEQTERVARTLA